MRFTLRTVMICVGVAAGGFWLFRKAWTGPSLVSDEIVVISVVLLVMGVVLAVTPPSPRMRVRPGWVAWLTRAILWGTAIAVLALRSDIDYLVFIATEAVMFATRHAPAYHQEPLPVRMNRVIVACVLTILIAACTAEIIQALSRRIASGISTGLRPLRAWWLGALLGIGVLAGLGVYQVTVSAPRLSESYWMATSLIAGRLDAAVLCLGFIALAGGISTRLARVPSSGLPARSAAIPGIRSKGPGHHLAWLGRLLLGLLLIPPGVYVIHNHWSHVLPRRQAMVFVVPVVHVDSFEPLLDPSNVFAWLVFAAGFVCVQAGAIWAVSWFWPRWAKTNPTSRFSLPLFLLWWAFLSVACLAAIPTVWLLVFPAWHLYLLNT